MVSIEGWLENWLKNCWADFASRQSGLFCKHHVGLVGYARCRKNGPLTCHPNWLWIMNYRYESCFGKKPSPRNTVIALGYIRQYLFAGDTGRAGSSSRSHVLELELSRLRKGFPRISVSNYGPTWSAGGVDVKIQNCDSETLLKAHALVWSTEKLSSGLSFSSCTWWWWLCWHACFSQQMLLSARVYRWVRS